MREILFKAKRLADDGWVYGDLSQHKTGKKFIKAGSAIHSFEVDADTICQYTGLTDKNGNKIWENDVVKDNVVFGTVVWDEKYAQFMIDDEFDGHQDYSDWWGEVEVIGNIFDNPELLKGSEEE